MGEKSGFRVPWRNGWRQVQTRVFFIFCQTVAIFNYFSKWSMLEMPRNFANSSNRTNLWQETKKILVQLAFIPFFSWLWVHNRKSDFGYLVLPLIPDGRSSRKEKMQKSTESFSMFVYISAFLLCTHHHACWLPYNPGIYTSFAPPFLFHIFLSKKLVVPKIRNACLNLIRPLQKKWNFAI